MAPIIGKVRGAANSLLAYTTGLRHLLHKPYTLKFPQQRYAVEKGFRGRHLLHLDRCTGLGAGALDWYDAGCYDSSDIEAERRGRRLEGSSDQTEDLRQFDRRGCSQGDLHVLRCLHRLLSHRHSLSQRQRGTDNAWDLCRLPSLLLQLSPDRASRRRDREPDLWKRTYS